MKRLFLSISILFMFLNSTLSYGHYFQGDDYVLILVTGTCNACARWGLSGKASMYVYSPTGSSNANNTPFVFVPVAEDIPLERHSAKAVTPIDEPDQIKYDYSHQANIPPGVYALHHHLFDYNTFTALENTVRHRLGLSDKPCFATDTYGTFDINSCCNNLDNPWDCCSSNDCKSSRCDEVIRFKEGETEHIRCFIQFHVAYNNLNEYRLNTNEGCIVLNECNFNSLFPFSFLELPTSPLIRHIPRKDQLSQKGRVIVFITDLTYNKKTSECDTQKAQIAYFLSLLNEQLNNKHFKNTPERQALKDRWALPPPLSSQNSVPKSIKLDIQ